MRFLLLLFFLCSCFWSKAGVYTVNILGYTYEDSTTNVTPLYEKVLSSSAYLKERKIIEKGNAILRKQSNKTGVFFLSLLMLYVFAGVRLAFSYQFAGSFDIFFKKSKGQHKASYGKASFAVLSFYILYFISLGLIAYHFVNHYNPQLLKSYPTVLVILFSILGITILFLLKILFSYLLSWIFSKKEQFALYLNNVSIVYKMSAIILFPLSIFILLSSGDVAFFFIRLSLFVIAAGIIWRYILNAHIIKKLLTTQFFHFILYLCAFEILPVLMILKFIRQNIS